MLRVIPEYNIAFSVLVNGGGKTMMSLIEQVFNDLTTPFSFPKQTGKSIEMDCSHIAGTYSDVSMMITIKVDSGDICAIISPKNKYLLHASHKIILKPVDQNTFLAYSENGERFSVGDVFFEGGNGIDKPSFLYTAYQVYKRI